MVATAASPASNATLAAIRWRFRTRSFPNAGITDLGSLTRTSLSESSVTDGQIAGRIRSPAILDFAI
jgi:hypothetical protein